MNPHVFEGLVLLSVTLTFLMLEKLVKAVVGVLSSIETYIDVQTKLQEHKLPEWERNAFEVEKVKPPKVQKAQEA